MNGTSLERERKIRSISFVCSANERTSENWKRKSIASTTTRGKRAIANEERTKFYRERTNGMRTLTKIKIGQNRTFGHNSDKYFFFGQNLKFCPKSDTVGNPEIESPICD